MSWATIRPATAPDLDALAALHAQCFAQAWSAAALGELLASPGAFALVADPTLGFVMARAAGGESEILTLAVSPAHRRAGLGRALVEAAASNAQADGASALFLEVETGNIAALALYRGLGFGEAGRRKGYYAAASGHAAQDALVFRADLPLGKAPRLD